MRPSFGPIIQPQGGTPVNVVARYPFLTDLFDTESPTVAFFTCPSTRQVILDDGTGGTFAANTPAFTGSGILLEGESTNDLVRNTNFANGAWTKTRMGVLSDDVTDPFGGPHGDRLIPNTDANSHFCFQAGPLTNTVQYSMSVFGRYYDTNYATFMMENTGDGATRYRLSYNTDTETAGIVTNLDNFDTEVMAGAFPWIRGQANFTASMNFASNQRLHQFANNSAGAAGNGTDGPLNYGYNLEANASRASSHIETFGSPVTRASCQLAALASTWPTNDGSVYIEVDLKRADPCTIWDIRPDVNNGIVLTTDGTQFIFTKLIGGVSHQAVVPIVPDFDTTYDIICQYSSTTGMELNVNGTTGTNANAAAFTMPFAALVGAGIGISNSSYNVSRQFTAANGTGYTIQDFKDIQ